MNDYHTTDLSEVSSTTVWRTILQEPQISTVIPPALTRASFLPPATVSAVVPTAGHFPFPFLHASSTLISLKTSWCASGMHSQYKIALRFTEWRSKGGYLYKHLNKSSLFWTSLLAQSQQDVSAVGDSQPDARFYGVTCTRNSSAMLKHFELPLQNLFPFFQ